MYGLALCLPSVGQPQGLPVSHEIPKTQEGKTRMVGSDGRGRRFLEPQIEGTRKKPSVFLFSLRRGQVYGGALSVESDFD
jgi:hypothetical protein